MTIPDYQSIMLPLLHFAGDGKVHSIHDAYSAMADYFRLSDEERKALLPSGKQKVIENRVSWARLIWLRLACCILQRGDAFKLLKQGKVS